MQKTVVTLIPGDGIGPEVTNATCRIIEAVGAPITWEICEAGASVFKKGLSTGLPQETLDSIKRNRVALKGPLETPIGYGERSANVTLRKYFDTFGNIRPIREFPSIPTPFSGRGIDFVIVRENVEDLYAGIEYRETTDTAECLKIITRPGCERICRLAFELARAEQRKKVHCATKANIMKLTEGLLKRVFEEVSQDYPEIQTEHIIVDNCAHMLVKRPEMFDVIVTTNMNGDILSDLSSALIGGLGFAPGANIGHDVAIFEAVHGSAPKYAGKNTINPTAVLLSGVMMLRHLNMFDAADRIEQALEITFKQGVATKDAELSTDPVSTTTFTDTLIRNLEKTPSQRRSYTPIRVPAPPSFASQEKGMIRGYDIYVKPVGDLESFINHAQTVVQHDYIHLDSVTDRGVLLWPDDMGRDAVVGDYLCLRFLLKDCIPGENHHLQNILNEFDWITVRKIYEIKDEGLGFTKYRDEKTSDQSSQ